MAVSKIHRAPTSRRRAKADGVKAFDKYALYLKSVQSPDNDVEFLEEVFEELRKKKPRSLREDFCGTAALCVAWVKRLKTARAYGVDLDPEPLQYGRDNYLAKLKPDFQKRIQLFEKNVMDRDLPKVDLSVGLNFSYFLFKERSLLKEYFANVYRGLNANGLAVFDVFGGTQCHDAIEDRTKLKGVTYYWEQTGFDPISNEALFHIHFRVGGKKIERVFSYDWRMWTIPELLDILKEVGFKKTHIYWEGTAKDGTGNGIFVRVEKGEPCLSWIAYIVAEK